MPYSKLKIKNGTQPTYLLVEICNDPLQIAYLFNIYFSSIASKYQDNIFKAGEGFEKYLKYTIPKNIFIFPTSQEIILQIINS